MNGSLNQIHWILRLRTRAIARCGVLALTMLIGNVGHADVSISITEASTSNNKHAHTLDGKSEQALQAMLSGDWTTTLHVAQTLTQDFPDYALGHLILAEAHTVLGMSNPLVQELPNFSMPLVDLLLEAKARVAQAQGNLSINAVSKQSVPNDIIQVGKHIDDVVLVDLHSSTLYLFETTSEQPRLIKEHYISSGEGGFGKLTEGDLKTPLGVYRVHGFRSDDTLPDLYGSGALMLNYPNRLDRALGRSGSGIWLHGNPRANRSRSPQSSEGCVTMANEHLTDLYHQIDIRRTHVILTRNIQWRDWADASAERERYHELFEQYRSAWINGRVSDLASLYTTDSLPDLVRYAHAAQAKKVSSDTGLSTPLSPAGIDLQALSQVQAEDVSVLRNPDLKQSPSGQHLVMAFELPDQNEARITIYWERKEPGYWQIKREEIVTNGV